ncbi:MAG: N-acetylglucosaminyldiphosphoundecaprenol N-acetyl-beta-D-mannosaminyltransferase [Candidatus Atribacteria bacterium]|nr:N-acetylglucosaminyldiphosphoundecaprenol N-acetyl-beta-D-mannosaminyltransferase [Candidatus Atribacteria bacterium]
MVLQVTEVELFGYRIVCSPSQVLNRVEEAIRFKRQLHLVTLNPEMVARQSWDQQFREVLQGAELLVPDGVGVVWAARLLGKRIPARISGVDLAEALFSEGSRQGWRVFLLGGSELVVERAYQEIKKRFPLLSIVGFHHGYFSEEKTVVEVINSQKPDIVLVGMGCPRQEFWIARFREQFAASVFVGVGGSFDVWSGLKPRAPRLIQKMGLEWLYRVAREPSRLRRIIPSFGRFGWIVAREWWEEKFGKK